MRGKCAKRAEHRKSIAEASEIAALQERVAALSAELAAAKKAVRAFDEVKSENARLVDLMARGTSDAIEREREVGRSMAERHRAMMGTLLDIIEAHDYVAPLATHAVVADVYQELGRSVPAQPDVSRAGRRFLTTGHKIRRLEKLASHSVTLAGTIRGLRRDGVDAERIAEIFKVKGED